MVQEQRRFSIRMADESTQKYREYLFLPDTEDIVIKVYKHAMHFLKFSKLSEKVTLSIIERNLTSLCHKVNMVKYHLRKYEEIEEKLNLEYEEDIKKPIREGFF